MNYPMAQTTQLQAEAQAGDSSLPSSLATFTALSFTEAPDTSIQNSLTYRLNALKKSQSAAELISQLPIVEAGDLSPFAAQMPEIIPTDTAEQSEVAFEAPVIIAEPAKVEQSLVMPTALGQISAPIAVAEVVTHVIPTAPANSVQPTDTTVFQKVTDVTVVEKARQAAVTALEAVFGRSISIEDTHKTQCDMDKFLGAANPK
jgi:hypothetical protein